MTPIEPNPLDQAALDWALRISSGPLSPADERAFNEWLVADPTHEARFESYLQVNAQLERTVPRMVASGQLADPRALIIRPAVFRRITFITAAAACLALAYFGFVRRPQEISTKVAHRQSVTLGDGSVVDLNALTDLSVQLRGAERRVTLSSGEAYFQVAKDGRPFLVETPAGTVRVTGTAFNVRSTASTQLEVTVIEGFVSVATSKETNALSAQDQLVTGTGGVSVDRLDSDAIREVVLWREGRIAFRAAPLASAAARIARYTGHRIDVDPSVSSLELGGRFRLDDVGAFLDAVEAALPVRIVRSSGLVRIVPRAP